jgi:putative transposase
MNPIPFEEGRFYHIFNRGNNKENLFIEEKNYSYFLQKLRQHILPICNLYAYCLMPNHFHLVLQIKENGALPNEYSLGKKKLHQPFSNFFNPPSRSAAADEKEVV